jgi:glycosyltransferase involved in cell wall biosynthesis
METISVVIPAYNEEDGIAAIVERVLALPLGTSCPVAAREN